MTPALELTSVPSSVDVLGTSPVDMQPEPSEGRATTHARPRESNPIPLTLLRCVDLTNCAGKATRGQGGGHLGRDRSGV